MGSHIDIEVVKRHLDSVGHTMSSHGVAHLLRDLGFSVTAEEEEEEDDVAVLRKSNIGEIISQNISAEAIYPSRTFKTFSATTAPSASTRATKRAPTSSAGIASLTAKLDKLEAQLNSITDLQTNLHHKLDIDQKRLPNRPAGAPSPSILGSEAQQLRDWAAGKWPNIQKYRPQTATSPSSLESETSLDYQSSTSSSTSNNSKRPASRNTAVLKKRDPVARYQ